LPVALLGAACGQDAPSTAPKPSVSASSSDARKVSFADDFETDPFPRWEPITQSAWSWEQTDRSQVFALTKNVPLTEPVRAPFNRNLIRKLTVGDFRLDVDLKSTTRDYPNQSLCLFFGYQDREHMYYAHLGRTSSDTSNQVFIVDGADRKPISAKTTSGTPWDDDWHHARVVRDVESGSIDVYFDDMTTPVMTAVDKTFTWGQVGIGSFDDAGQFDNVVVRGQRAERPPS
jgi:hypothetical protein